MDIDALNDILSYSIDGKLLNSIDKNKILIILKELCEKNLQLKSENEHLKNENSELKRENNDFKSIIYNSEEEFSKNLENGKKSTPIKHDIEMKNFITYQALNIVENISYSNEDDCEFDCESIYLDKKCLTLTDLNGFTMNTMTEINYIENEEMPSRFVKDQSTQSNQKFSLIDSMKKELIKEVTSIEDEKMPETFESTSENESDKSADEPKSIIFCENEHQNDLEMIKSTPINNNVQSIPIILTIFIVLLIIVVYLVIFHTKIPPLYSIEEIIIDILNQYCTKTRILSLE